ncbi:MAG: HU family DNA-binding protein [Planctomycetota bacterium]
MTDRRAERLLPHHSGQAGWDACPDMPEQYTMAKKAAAKPKPLSKAEIYATLAERTELSKKDVSLVFDEMVGLIEQELKDKKGARTFALPGLMKIYVHHKPRQPARMGRNPATGEPVQISAKPAMDVVKVRVLKGLKEMI